jgi:hypothetical protein
MTTHSKLSPSSRYRWQLCPASANACTQYEKDKAASSPAAIDGTHSHTLLEYCLKHKDGIADPHLFIGMILADHEGQFSVDKARAERVKLAVDYIRHRVAEMDNPTVISEKRVNPKAITNRDDLSGTVDVQIRSAEILEIVDYKDGMNPVSAEHNPQLEQYAIGVISEMIDKGEALPSVLVRMTIIQPKLALKNQPALSSADITVEELMSDGVMSLVNEAALTDEKDAPFVPGEKQCMYCPHRGNCSAAATWTLEKSGIKFGPIPSAEKPDPTVMPDERIAQLVENAPMLRKMLEGAEAEAVKRISSGHEIPGLKVVRGPGRREWVKSDEEIALRLKQMGMPKDEIWRVSLVSPAQVEKAEWVTKAQVEKRLTEKQLAVLANEFIGKSEGKLTAVPASDPRSGIDFGKMEEMFKPVEETPDWLK